MKHVEVDGTWYRLAEDAEGTHYALTSDPLRPPNSTVVQGDTSDKFQLRPDLLLWTWTDWSGGEGQLKFNPAEPNRARLLQGVDPFSRPGELQLGYKEDWAQISSGGDWTYLYAGFTQALSTLYAYSAVNQRFWVWDRDNEEFGTIQTPTISTNGFSGETLCGDANYLFFVGPIVEDKLIRFDGTTWTYHNDQWNAEAELSDDEAATLMGDYVYIHRLNYGELYELSASVANLATPETPLYEFPPGDSSAFSRQLVQGGNRIYFYTTHGNDTVVHEVFPSSAAGTGYGRELALLEGLVAECMWWGAGIIYILARDQEVIGQENLGCNRFIMYVDAEGSYGTLGGVRNFDEVNGRPAPNKSTGTAGTYAIGGRFGRTAFVLPAQWEEETADEVAQSLWEVDGVTGGYAAVGRAPTDETDQNTHYNLGYFDGKYFNYLSDQQKIAVWDTSEWSLQEGIAISPKLDFGIAEEKILERIELSCEPLPNDADRITVGYRLDEGDWVDEAIVGAADEVGGTLVISSAASTKTFRTMEARIKLSSELTTTTPRVKNLDVYARVNKHIRTWDLLIDASDDAAPQGHNGAQVVSNLLGIPDDTVISFTDKYRSHDKENAGQTYDVVVDSSQYILSQDGEGFVQIRLIELGSSAGTTPTFVGAGVMDDGTGDITPEIHEDTADGDAMILAIETVPGTGDPGTLTGWTQHGFTQSQPTGFGDATKLWIYYKIYADGDPDPFIADIGNHMIGQIYSFRGIDPDDFPHKNEWGSEITNDTTVDSFTPVTTTTNGCLIVGILAQGAGTPDHVTSAWDNSSLGLVTKQAEEFTVAGIDGALTMVTGEKSGSGASGSFGATCAGSNEEATITIALASPTGD